MNVPDAFGAGQRALRDAREALGSGFDPGAFGTGVQAMARWASPRWFDESIFETDALLAFIGSPTQLDGESFLLESSVGPAPLTAPQKDVIDAIIDAGTWASVNDLPERLRSEIVHMLNLGLLYAWAEDDNVFYREDLFPVARPQASEPPRMVRAGDTPDSIVVATPRGSGEAEMPLISLAVWNAISGVRSTEEVVQYTLSILDQSQRTAIAAGAARDGISLEVAMDNVLGGMLRTGIIALVQAGFFWLDIR